ncbi:LytTR family DNA-binding domain-containing protein [Bariatricus sp. HCP28S3_A7]|uniref:LytTR family DNA-binding domain-containing protein n=1 Tax=Bariatricus sp. HCP28S3_A7 TaxID=3438894 RepID=UPI003F8B25E9
MHCKYVCRTKTSVSIIHIYDINYITVSGHQLTIHTECGTFSKYGTLTKELKLLSSYGFIRCSQNYIVALSKIKSITENTIIMMDHSKIHISRNYTSKVIMAFTMQSKK